MHDWMIRVLDDVAEFARTNSYDHLAEEVTRCAALARSEIRMPDADIIAFSPETEAILHAAQPDPG